MREQSVAGLLFPLWRPVKEASDVRATINAYAQGLGVGNLAGQAYVRSRDRDPAAGDANT